MSITVYTGDAPPPVDRAPGESEEEHALALAYILDPSTTHRSLADDFGVPLGHVASISARHRWAARRRAYHARMALELSEQAHLDRISEHEAYRDALSNLRDTWVDILNRTCAAIAEEYARPGGRPDRELIATIKLAREELQALGAGDVEKTLDAAVLAVLEKLG